MTRRIASRDEPYMAIVISPIEAQQLAEYASVPIAFEVRSVLAVEQADGGLGGLVLREEAIQSPCRKDYEAYGDGGPLEWPVRWDISRWGIWIAREGSQAVGGAAVAWNTPGVNMLEGRTDLAVLWDIRVRPSYRGPGIGTALFKQAASWARSNGCRYLKVETQNTNVDACRFYARMGCFLGQIDRLAYRTCPQVAREVMLLWYLDLSTRWSGTAHSPSDRPS